MSGPLCVPVGSKGSKSQALQVKGIDPNLWHLVTTSLASDTGQRDGRCVQTGGQDSQMTEFTTITTDSELTIPGFRERAQDAQSS